MSIEKNSGGIKLMKTNLTNSEQLKTKGQFIELTGIRAAEVSKYWKVEILEFKRDIANEANFAIRLTSTLRGQSVTFLKEFFEENGNSKKILNRLSKIGVIKPSYIKVIAASVNDGLYEQPEKITFVQDINSLLETAELSGVSPEAYYKKFIRYFKDNLHLFPKRSSNKYIHNVSKGIIIDGMEKYPMGEHGHYPVAIRTGALQELFEIDSDNKYRAILDSLVKMGVLQGKLQFKDYEEKEGGEVFYDHYGKTEIDAKTSNRMKKRLDKRITMNTKKQEANVLIFNINLEVIE